MELHEKDIGVQKESSKLGDYIGPDLEAQVRSSSINRERIYSER